MLSYEVLPSLVAGVEDESLRHGLEEHLRETRAQSERAEKAFRTLGFEPSSNRSGPLEALAKEHDELAGKLVQPQLRDAFHAAAAAATEHLELALYDAAIELANAIGAPGETTDLLAESRGEEERALQTVEEERRRLVGEAAG